MGYKREVEEYFKIFIVLVTFFGDYYLWHLAPQCQNKVIIFPNIIKDLTKTDYPRGHNLLIVMAKIVCVGQCIF